MSQARLASRSIDPPIVMSPASRLILVFVVASAVFWLVPPLLSRPLGVYPLMRTEDAFTLLGPLAIIPAFWVLFQAAEERQPSARSVVLFLVLAALWADGHGMHLAANSISHLLEGAESTASYQLTYFYDEVASHYMYHFATVALSVLVIAREWRARSSGLQTSLRVPSAAGVAYGIVVFMIVVEGQTAPLGVPAAALIGLGGLWLGRGRLREKPFLAFFIASYLVATVLFAAWAAYWGGLPELSEVGLLS